MFKLRKILLDGDGTSAENEEGVRRWQNVKLIHNKSIYIFQLLEHLYAIIPIIYIFFIYIYHRYF